MKIRNCHVSNSSSSSFIVEFPRKPETKEDLIEMMGECYPLGGYCFTTKHVIDAVWKDMEQEQALGDFKSFEDFVNRTEKWDLNWQIDQMASELELPEGAQAKLEVQVKELLMAAWKAEHTKPNCHVHRFVFADEDGEFWGAMEHGDIFRNLTYTRKSYH